MGRRVAAGRSEAEVAVQHATAEVALARLEVVAVTSFVEVGHLALDLARGADQLGGALEGVEHLRFLSSLAEGSRLSSFVFFSTPRI